MVKASFAAPLLECHQCGKPTAVPTPTPAPPPESHDLPLVKLAPPSENPAPSPPDVMEQLAEIQRHLKENESQRTEVNGHINQLNIQIHRWQLRLQTLNTRNQELTRQIAELNGPDQTRS